MPKSRPKNRKAAKARQTAAQVFPFQILTSGDDEFDRKVEPRTGDRTKDRALQVIWKHLKNWDTERLALVLGSVARSGLLPVENDDVEVDTGDVVRDALLERCWRYFRMWTVLELVTVIQVIVRYGLEDSGEMVAVEESVCDVLRSHARASELRSKEQGTTED